MSAEYLELLCKTKEEYGEEFEKHLFEQYKLYVEMADRISARRILANSFFVGVNTALITAFTALFKEKVLLPTLLGMAPFFAVILLCLVWWLVVHSYRQLNTGKFRVILAMEQMLPVAPYDTEWKALGSGRDLKLYTPITHIENLVPLCFVVLYIILAITIFFEG